ncbi:MAG: TolC family protein [Terriglobales bacterium]
MKNTRIFGGTRSWIAVAFALALALVMGVVMAESQGLPPVPPSPPPQVRLPLPGAGAADLAGGVAPGGVAAQPVALTLEDAIERGLRQNLAPLLAQDASQLARAQRLQALSALLPQVDLSAGEQRQKLNLQAFGLSLPGVNPIVGPFNVFQASGAAEVPLINVSGLQNVRAARGLESAARDNVSATRDLVVLAVANQYLLSVADAARVEAAQAELATAESALQQAQDMLHAGTVDRLVAVRAQVQRDRQQQQLTAAQNALAKQRLQLARAIGLPPSQAFTLTSASPYAELAPPAPEQAVAQALAARPDYRASQAVVRSAQFLVAAARDQHLPTVALNGNYGTIGHEISSNHPVFAVGATVELPVYTGGAIHAQQLQAEAQLHEAQSRNADLKAAIEVQVRSALFDLQNNRDQVGVARDASALAQQELTLAQDRFRAGVTDNLEVVQAQQSVADAQENYISSLFGYNLAKASLAQALGVAVSDYRHYLPIQ